MKDISLASAGLLQALSESPVQTNGHEGGGACESPKFRLPEMALDAIGQRAHMAKSEADHQGTNADQSAQMQMLLSLFLTPGPQPDPQRNLQFSLPDDCGKLLHTLSQMQNRSANRPDKATGFFDAVTPVTDGTIKAQTDSVAINTLPPELHAALASLMPSSSQTPTATPVQQAKLAQIAAQDLRAIAPERATTPAAPRISARTGEPRSTVRIAAAKTEHPDNDRGNVPQMLTNTAFIRHGGSEVNNASPREVTVALDTRPDDLGEQITTMLKERIQFQLSEQQQVSTIRLDPPSLGKLNISVQLDAGRLTVHIDASQADVSRALTQLSDNLRQHLIEQNFVQVNVQVSSDGRSQQGSQQQGN